MTNEEAIKILQGAIKKPNTKDGYLGQAIDMAIKALEQESITWIVGNDNCQVAVRNMPIDKMQKICAIIGEKEQQPCEDCVKREDAKKFLYERLDRLNDDELYDIFSRIIDDMYNELPSVTPKFTDEEIQKMQELEQAQLEKAYELGMQTSFEEWLSTFNTDSATECFTAVKELKRKIEKGESKNEN